MAHAVTRARGACRTCGRLGGRHSPHCPEHPRRRDLTPWEEWREWHLTPDGWVRGDTQDIEPIAQRQPVPADRLLTVRLRAWVNRDETVFAPEQIAWCTRWPEDAVAAWSRLGPPPDSWFQASRDEFTARIRSGDVDRS